MTIVLLLYLAIGAIFACWFCLVQIAIRGRSLDDLSRLVEPAFDQVPRPYRDLAFIRFLSTPSGVILVHGLAWPAVVYVSLRDVGRR